MLTVNFSKSFVKSYSKRIKSNNKLKFQFEKRTDLFKIDRLNSLLKDHGLIGDKKGLRSFSVSGDCRVIYRMDSEDFVEFIDIGSHNQVY